MSSRPHRTFGYGRASTRKQEASPETQKEQIRAYAVFHKLGDVTFMVDSHTSGKVPLFERDAGRELLKQLRAGDHVIISKLDRAFRRLSDCVVVLDQLEKLKVKLHICNLMGGLVELSSPMGRFLIHILAAFAELERSFIAERTRDGIQKRKKLSIRHTKYAGYGFDWEKRKVDGKTIRVKVRNEEERNVMRSIVAWRMQDEPLSWEEIEVHLNVTLKLVTKEGRPWDKNRIRRCCKTELMLQLAEQRGNR